MNKKSFAAIMVLAMLAVVIAPAALATVTFPNLAVSMVNQEPDPVAPGSNFDVRFRIENDNGGPANNVQVKLVLSYPLSFYGEDNGEVRKIGTVTSSQQNDVGVVEKWTLFVDPNAATGNDKIEVWYKIDTGSWTKAGEYEVTIRSPNPFLAIKEITTDPARIIPGTTTKVSFVLANMASNSLKDISLNLQVYKETDTATGISVTELPFTPLGSGNEKTLALLPKSESAALEFEIFTDANAASKVYKVPYTLTYKDSDGQNFTRSGVLGLLVDSDPELSVYIEESQAKLAGSSGIVTVKLVNKGFSDIKFLDAKLEEAAGFKLLSTPEVYIGKLDSDDYETAEYTVLIDKGAKGSVTLPLRIDYRDANGKLYTRNVPLELKVYTADELKQNGKSGSGAWIWVVILVLAAGGFIYYRRRKKSIAAKKR